MPDFDARPTAGVTVATWTDPRANPLPSRPHRHFRGTTGTPIVVTAEVGGVWGPDDAALFGRQFAGRIDQCPGAPPAISSTAGRSSVQQFTPTEHGHYAFVISRRSGGAMVFHFDA